HRDPPAAAGTPGAHPTGSRFRALQKHLPTHVPHAWPATPSTREPENTEPARDACPEDSKGVTAHRAGYLWSSPRHRGSQCTSPALPSDLAIQGRDDRKRSLPYA